VKGTRRVIEDDRINIKEHGDEVGMEHTFTHESTTRCSKTANEQRQTVVNGIKSRRD